MKMGILQGRTFDECEDCILERGFAKKCKSDESLIPCCIVCRLDGSYAFALDIFMSNPPYLDS